MKFSLFAHMERGSTEQSHSKLYEDFIALCQMADDGAMHAIWSGEHHGMDFTIAPNPFITIADLARRTRHVRLGTGTVVAPFWHPIKLAGEAAMADIISGGRLELGLARGAYSFEYERLVPGMNAMQAGQRLREMLPAVKGLWRGDYQHDGEFHQFPKTTSSPKPMQVPGPPIWVAARDPGSHAFAIANDCNVQVTPLWLGDGEIQTLKQRFDDACAAADKLCDSKIMLLQHAHVAANADEVDAAAQSLSRFYCHFGAWFKNERPISQGLIQPLSGDEMAAIEMYSPAAMRSNLTIGTAREVIDRLKRYQDLGYDEYAYWIDSGMSPELKRSSLARFIDEVMPAFA
ncbi:MAG: alkanesulfonate monooxygenase SsuD [Gammaproteobacteria bacterium]|jgi:alkanesulfonate monooxygenase SsuD/methylene tetrahydromethanopterin reductase-like flavin-dependent oxidoreductase (luciferase family)